MRVRELAVPLQAFIAVSICLSLGWMVYAMAFFDPTPPTAADLKSPATDDPQIDVYKTAAALTFNAVFAFGPTQILLPTGTPTFTSTMTFTITPALVQGLSPTSTGTATFVALLTPTRDDSSNPNPATKTPTASATNVPTSTPRPTLTTVPSPTATPVTPTDVPTDEPTATNEPDPTETPVEPTATNEPDPTATEPPVLNTSVP